MQKKVLIWSIVLILILIIGGFYIFKKDNSQKIENNLNPEETTEYVGEQRTIIRKDFRAIIKEDWQESEVNPSVYIYLPPNTTQTDENAETISIVVMFLGEENQYTLEELLDKGVENSRQLISDFELTENIDKENDYFEGKRIKFTGTSEGVKRENTQFFGIKYNNIYVITYSCPINNCNYYAIYNNLVESFEPVEVKK